MRSTIVKTLFYSSGVGTGCCIGYNSVLISLRNFYPVTDRHAVLLFSVNVVTVDTPVHCGVTFIHFCPMSLFCIINRVYLSAVIRWAYS